MLKITMEVKSGTQQPVMPSKVKGSYIEKFKLKHNPENRPLFLRGILMALMGERVSQYAIAKDPVETFKNDPENLKRFTSATDNLNGFLNKIELKGNIKAFHSSHEYISFSQHRKHGFPAFAGYKIVKESLVPIDENNSRLSSTYSDYIQEGLLDIFLIDERQVSSLLVSKNADKALDEIKAVFSSLLGNEDNFDGVMLDKDVARSTVDKLAKVFGMWTIDEKLICRSGDYIYPRVMDVLAENDAIKKYLNAKKSPYQKAQEERKESENTTIDGYLRKLDDHKILFAFFAMRYLDMYCRIDSACSKFGIANFNFKSKKICDDYLKWLESPVAPLTESRSQNGYTEFYKSFFIASKYGVSTNAPVLMKKYDGVFELYVKTDDETEEQIRQRIKKSGVWITRVGKLSYGRLLNDPACISNRYWEEIEDDVIS